MKYLHDTLNISNKSLQRILFYTWDFWLDSSSLNVADNYYYGQYMPHLILRFLFRSYIQFLGTVVLYVCFFLCVFNILTFTFNSWMNVFIRRNIQFTKIPKNVIFLYILCGKKRSSHLRGIWDMDNVHSLWCQLKIWRVKMNKVMVLNCSVFYGKLRYN